MADKETTTYIFLASRKYPITSPNNGSEQKEDGTPLNETKKGREIIALDVTTSFTNSWEADLTKYPVSSGSEISDHLSIRNNKYTLKGIVSDTPIEPHTGEYLGQLGTGGARIIAAIEVLQKMFKERVPFTLFSEFQKIENVVITKVDFDQAPENAIAFSIQFEEVRFAYAKTVSLNVKASKKKSVASNTNGGSSAKGDAKSLSDHRSKIEELKKVNERANQ